MHTSSLGWIGVSNWLKPRHYLSFVPLQCCLPIGRFTLEAGTFQRSVAVGGVLSDAFFARPIFRSVQRGSKSKLGRSADSRA